MLYQNPHTVVIYKFIALWLFFATENLFAGTGRFGIFAMNSYGGNITRLTDTDTFDNHAYVSPDGMKIIFTRFRNTKNGVKDADGSEPLTVIMNSNGTNSTSLTPQTTYHFDFHADFSPDGTKIVFSSNRQNLSNPNESDIFVMDLYGNVVSTLTNTPFPVCEYDPHWGPNGKIVFNRVDWSSANKNPAIWIMNEDGSNQVQLTTPAISGTWNKYPFGDMDPVISPDGTKIAFQRHQNTDEKINQGYGDWDIYVMNIDGTNLTDISKNTNADAMPRWSANGKQLVFWGTDESNPENKFAIYVINTDGSSRRKISLPENLIPQDPSWYPATSNNPGLDIVFNAEISTTSFRTSLLANVKIYPNPLKLTEGILNYFIFDNLPENTEIKIFNIAGELVKTITPGEINIAGSTRWYLKNDSGCDVASGIYLCLFKHSSGETIVKKFALIK